LHLHGLLGKSKIVSVLACQSSPRHATPAEYRLRYGHRANQITYGSKYEHEQKCPQLITGSYICGTKKVNANVLHPSRYLSPKSVRVTARQGSIYLREWRVALIGGHGATRQTTTAKLYIKSAKRNADLFRHKSPAEPVNVFEAQTDCTGERFFDQFRTSTYFNKGHTTGDEQWLRQEHCSQLGLHRSWQCN
jgi:hypothetical protein